MRVWRHTNYKCEKLPQFAKKNRESYAKQEVTSQMSNQTL